MLTAREYREFMAYCVRYPIDDEANFQQPSAMIQAMYVNRKRAEADQPALDYWRFMPFKLRWDDAMAESMDIEDQLRLWAKMPAGEE